MKKRTGFWAQSVSANSVTCRMEAINVQRGAARKLFTHNAIRVGEATTYLASWAR